MNRSLWGEFCDGSDRMPEVQLCEMVLPQDKQHKFAALQSINESRAEEQDEVVELRLENILVNQTVEVTNQTECIQTLIDTYATDNSGLNDCVLNPFQLIPRINFQSESTANLVKCDKIIKPFNFIPPQNSDFINGVPVDHPIKITSKIAEAAIKKSLCGLLNVAGFNECTESAMSTLTQAVIKFYRSLLDGVREQLMHDGRDHEYEIDALTLEKVYHTITSNSLLSLNQYYNKEIILKNAQGIIEFKEKFLEYDKLVQESHNNMQKTTIKEEQDYMGFLTYSTTGADEDSATRYVFTNNEEGVDNNSRY